MAWTRDRDRELSAEGWIDVTRPLREGIPVWPGDVPFRMDLRQDNGVIIGSLSSTFHVGTHVDAPLHLGRGGEAVDAIPLGRLMGPAEVVRAPGPGARVGRDELPPSWRPQAPRVLFATESFPADATEIMGGFRGLAVELIQFLAGCGVVLVGVDTPSVDPMDSEKLEAHRALAAAGMIWIEGLLLDGVPEGLYHMVALPLALMGAEASPTRVVLRRLHGGSG